jgi:hypothetical protein
MVKWIDRRKPDMARVKIIKTEKRMNMSNHLSAGISRQFVYECAWKWVKNREVVGKSASKN